MRSDRSRFPVDRYLVESRQKVEMVNIIDDNIWATEPALKPEDEIILRKLHEMLQSTADDLKLLSGELSKYHEPGVQVKSQPTPLDEEFNEKVHIEEIVNAKFHGHKIVAKSSPFPPESKPNKNRVNEMLATKTLNNKTTNTGVQVNFTIPPKPTKLNKKLQLSQTKVIQIKDCNEVPSKSCVLNSAPVISYNEVVHKYNEQKNYLPNKVLKIQNMPSVCIRSELKKQQVLHLDILPESMDDNKISKTNTNIGVIKVQYEPPPMLPLGMNKSGGDGNRSEKAKNTSSKPVRKISKMSTCESSESTNNISSENHHKQFDKVLKTLPKRPKTVNVQSNKTNIKRSNLDIWKKKLNSVYGQPSTSKNKKSPKKQSKVLEKCSNSHELSESLLANIKNTEYIPYKKLTLGGITASEIEKEISDLPNNKDLQLSPIIDKILSSQENSFNMDSPKHHKNLKVLTTSDENLLHEVLELEKTISDTLSKPLNTSAHIREESKVKNESVHSGENTDNMYDDDFEEDKSDLVINKQSNGGTSAISSNESENSKKHNETYVTDHTKNDTTFTKVSNLTFKNSVDIFEFVHSIDTHETGTQSNTSSKISLKETQTSPRADVSNLRSIHNNLWPSIDPKGDVEKMFQLEKDLIKKYIIDEYGEFVEKIMTKPSTSKEQDQETLKQNVAAFQKDTQTSPAHVKCIMTSPTRTKTRTTSPFSRAPTVDRQTSPIVLVTNEVNDQLNINLENETEDLGITINLSSPRFNLRLPQTSREVLSNLSVRSHTPHKFDADKVKSNNKILAPKSFIKHTVSSSSSLDGDNSSSEISSLGEIRLKRKIRKLRVTTVSESSTSTILSKSSSDFVLGEILPLKSEGEISSGQISKKTYKSEGEMNNSGK